MPYTEQLKKGGWHEIFVPKPGLEFILSYLRNNLKLAVKNVFFNYKQYICFFVAMFVIQTFFGLLTIASDNSNKIEYDYVQQEYDYHMVLRDLNQDQANFLLNDELAVFKNDHVFEVVRYDENYNYISDTTTYDMFIDFIGEDLDASEAKFRSKYFKELAAIGTEGGSIKIATTPYLNFGENLAANTASYIFLCLVLMALSIYLLIALYNIRINHYKFLYGVYMTFGADFKKLFQNAFWELFIVSMMTFPLSMVASAFIVKAIYSSVAIGYYYSWTVILKIFLYNLIIVLTSVFFPMRIMAIRQPMSLIVAQDNSNLVSSPYRSKNIFNKTFPRFYEMLSQWRFRNYNAQLLVTAILFTTMFICGLYLSVINQTSIDYPQAQFTINIPTNNGFYYNDEMVDELYAIEGVKEVMLKDNTTKATALGNHIAFSKEYALPFKNLTVHDSMEGYRVLNTVDFKAVDKAQIQILEKYTYEGDLYSVLNEENTIIVGDSVSNVRTLEYEVGDEILIAVVTKRLKTVDSNLSGKALLKDQLRFYEFEYHTFKIGAIIKDIPSGNLPVFMNIADYGEIINADINFSSIDIYADESYSVEEMTRLEVDLKEWGLTYGKMNIANNHALNQKNIDNDKNYSILFVCLAILILVISPLVWFFSQTLYYMKRENEFNILQALGASVRDIRKIYVQGGLVMGSMSFVVCVILSYLGSYGLFYVFNVMIPKFTYSYVRYDFYMPWYAILSAVVISVFCGFMSAYLPFRSYIKHRSTLEMGNEYTEET